MFRATKGSGVTITTILRNNAIETRPGNKIHHLGEKRSACVHCAPDWKTRIGEDVTSRILDRVQGATKKNTSETLVLQRYAEIVRSVNRTAVTRDGYSKFARLGLCRCLNSQKRNVSQPKIECYTNFPRIQDWPAEEKLTSEPRPICCPTRSVAAGGAGQEHASAAPEPPRPHCHHFWA